MRFRELVEGAEEDDEDADEDEEAEAEVPDEDAETAEMAVTAEETAEEVMRPGGIDEPPPAPPLLPPEGVLLLPS